MEALLFVNMGDDALNAKNVEVLLFVNMGDNALAARSVEVLLFVNMGDDALNAKHVEAFLFVNTDEFALTVRNVEALLFVNIKNNALDTKNVAALLFANMGDIALNMTSSNNDIASMSCYTIDYYLNETPSLVIGPIAPMDFPYHSSHIQIIHSPAAGHLCLRVPIPYCSTVEGLLL